MATRQDFMCTVGANDCEGIPIVCSGILVSSAKMPVVVSKSPQSHSTSTPKMVLLTTAHSVGTATQPASIIFHGHDGKYTFDCNPSAFFDTCCADSPHIGEPCPKKLDFTIIAIQDRGKFSCCINGKTKTQSVNVDKLEKMVFPVVVNRAMPLVREQQCLMHHYYVPEKNMKTIPIQVTQVDGGKFQHNGQTSAGSSGGAITIDGRLVGMHTAVTQHDDKSAVMMSRILMYCTVIPEDGYENIISFLREFSGKIHVKEDIALEALLRSIKGTFATLEPKDRLEKVMKDAELLDFLLKYFSLDGIHEDFLNMEQRKGFLKYGVWIFDVLLEDIDLVCCHPTICNDRSDSHKDVVHLEKNDVDTLCKILECIEFSLNNAAKDDEITRKHAFSCVSRLAKLKHDEISNKMCDVRNVPTVHKAVCDSKDQEVRKFAADTFLFNLNYNHDKLVKLQQEKNIIEVNLKEEIKTKELENDELNTKIHRMQEDHQNNIKGLQDKLAELQQEKNVIEVNLKEEIKTKELENDELNTKIHRMQEDHQNNMESLKEELNKMTRIDEDNGNLQVLLYQRTACIVSLKDSLSKCMGQSQSESENDAEISQYSDTEKLKVLVEEAIRRLGSMKATETQFQKTEEKLRCEIKRLQDGQQHANSQPAGDFASPLNEAAAADLVRCEKETGTAHINHMNLDMKKKIKNELNLKITGMVPGYQYLADELGMPPEEIRWLAQEENPTGALLEWWGNKEEATISKLHKKLKKIKYTNLAKDLAECHKVK